LEFQWLADEAEAEIAQRRGALHLALGATNSQSASSRMEVKPLWLQFDVIPQISQYPSALTFVHNVFGFPLTIMNGI
jgi:hypothetical protein